MQGRSVGLPLTLGPPQCLGVPAPGLAGPSMRAALLAVDLTGKPPVGLTCQWKAHKKNGGILEHVWWPRPLTHGASGEGGWTRSCG